LSICRIARRLDRVPVRQVGIYSTDKDFVHRLVMHNAQRVKSAAEIFREQFVQVDPQDAPSVGRTSVGRGQTESEVDEVGVP
jgi:hypothetical protein